MSVIERAHQRFQQGGLAELGYWAIRYTLDDLTEPLRPRRPVSMNGVSVASARYGDRLFPWQHGDLPGYEAMVVDGIREYASSGDTVVVIGGGWGVSTVVASQQVGSDGRIICYEPAAEQAERVRDTLRRNETPSAVELRETVVAEAVEVWGDTTAAERIAPSELPAADVLVMDCEGAEASIIPKLDMQPRAIVVETHDDLGAPVEEMTAALADLGYSVVEQDYPDPLNTDGYAEDGTFVLYAEVQ